MHCGLSLELKLFMLPFWQLEKVSSIAAQFMGRPLSHLPPLLNPMHVSPLELFHSGPSLDFDLLTGSSSSSMTVTTLPSQPNLVLSDMDKSLMTNISVTAMEELLRLTQTNEALWIKTSGCRDVLNLQRYENMFPRSSGRGGKNHNVRKEATRSSGVVFTNAITLVNMLMDSVSLLNSKSLVFFFSHVVSCSFFSNVGFINL